MTTDRDEALSRLLDGELPDDEAHIWRARIATEPDVAAAWVAMRQLVDALDVHPLDAPPPGLDAEVLRSVPKVRGSWMRWGRWAVAAAAAFFLVALATQRPRDERPPTVVLGVGAHRVEGDVRALINGVEVDVDGVSRIVVRAAESESVEPSAAVARAPEGQATEAPMIREAGMTLGGAAAGAVVTVFVLKGTADVQVDEPTQLIEGQSVSIPVPALAPAPHPEVPTGPSPVIRDLGMALTRIAELEDEIFSLRVELGISNGQLTGFTGTPVSWPDDVPESYRPDAMQARMEGTFGDASEDVGLELDCAEYPCIMLVTIPGGIDDDAFDRLLGPLTQGLEDPAVLLARSRVNRNGAIVDAQAITLLDRVLEPDQAQRTEYRLHTLADSITGPE